MSLFSMVVCTPDLSSSHGPWLEPGPVPDPCIERLRDRHGTFSESPLSDKEPSTTSGWCHAASGEDSMGAGQCTYPVGDMGQGVCHRPGPSSAPTGGISALDPCCSPSSRTAVELVRAPRPTLTCVFQWVPNKVSEGCSRLIQGSGPLEGLEGRWILRWPVRFGALGRCDGPHGPLRSVDTARPSSLVHDPQAK